MRLRLIVAVGGATVIALVVIALASSASSRRPQQTGGHAGGKEPVANPLPRPSKGRVAEARVPGCKKPSPRSRVIASSQKVVVYRVGPVTFKGCLRGTHRLYDLEVPRRDALVRTRGHWVAFTTSGIYNDGSGPSYYDMYLIELRHGRLRGMDLKRGHVRGSWNVRELALDGHGVVLYVQRFDKRERLILRGQTRRRRLGSGPAGTFDDLRLRHRRASWTKNGRPGSARFEVIHHKLPYKARSRPN